ncbi:uncharacterized protein LOC117288707 isoform X1 [Asterias rubens]|uniref:uncharacterized protein LOC117288707 isoform X1 n=2 Tax=Asterias rubens TaxID=7604 RepID=UPI001455774E|nr:uncharacterized protein LOC117288707 isoform X1 [Asterias rubens]XP_033625453.1 uncharacterized protein LOC117288707 isoform X1 [Asterias rubens]
MEDRDGCDQGDDRGQESLTAGAGTMCTVAEMEDGTAVFITSRASLVSTDKPESKKDSSMEIAPSLITLYDKYASDRELMSIQESEPTETESPNRTNNDEEIIDTEQGTTGTRVSEDQEDKMAKRPECLMNNEPDEEDTEATTPTSPNQSFLYKPTQPDMESDFDLIKESLKPRSESCAAILDEESTRAKMDQVETEITCTTAHSESKSNSTSLEKHSNLQKRKNAATTPPEKTDTNANLRSFQRTLSFGARLARTKFSQFIENNALGKSKGEVTNKKPLDAVSPVKPRQRLRSDSEPAPMAAIRMDPKRKSSRINPTILAMAEVENDAMSPTASPASTPPLKPKSPQFARLSLSYLDQKCKELLDTERNYVVDLADIIEGYKYPMALTRNLMSRIEQDTLFGNILEIHAFNNKLLKELQQCNNDAVLIAECFLDNEKRFSVYTDYCTNYPNTVEILMDIMAQEDVVEFFRECQQYLNHPLPLGAYLLKPVQRVLKYHLFFQDMYKHFNKDDDGYDTIGDTLDCMTDIARYINEMKRKHEASVHVQEIQSQLIGWEGDLMSSGDLVLEDIFRMQGARAERYLYLFEKVLLIGKKREDTLISVKTHIPCNNLMLIESLQKEPLGFNVIPFNNPSIQYTILARNVDQKKLWTHEIKRLILENYGSTIPTKVKDLILKSTTSAKTESDKESQTEQEEQAREKKERKSRRRQKRRNSEPMGKLMRGQKQVKAAVESMIIKGMKKPELSKWAGRRSSEFYRDTVSDEESDNESIESPSRKPSLVDESNPARRGSLSACSDSTRTPDSRSPDKQDQPLANNLSQRLSRNSIEFDGNVSSTHSDEERDRAMMERSNLTRKRESNRDSGIGSMTLSEHAAVEGDKDGSGSSRRPDRGNKTSEDLSKKIDPVRKRLGLDDSEEDDDNAIVEVVEGPDSPDELEALETLPETVNNAAVGHEDAVDLETLPSYIKKFSPSEPFKLRHSNIKGYRPLGARKNGDVWIPMSLGPHMRSRSVSYGNRPFSADAAMHTPHQRMPLSRCNSEDRQMLAAVSEMYSRSRSDPNMLETSACEDRSRSACCIPTYTEHPHTPESPQAVSEESSTFSSNENLLESVNNAFKLLGEKYSQLDLSENKDEDESESSKDGTESTANTISAGTESTEERTIIEPPPMEEPKQKIVVQPKVKPRTKTVNKLAREFSRKAKESPKLIVTRQSSSDSCLEQTDSAFGDVSSAKDDKGVDVVVRSKRVTKVTSRFETFQRAMTENEKWQAPSRRARYISDSVFHAVPVTATGSSSEEEKTQDTPTSTFSRSARNRRSVRDVVRRFEKPKSLKKESKAVTPTVMGIQERLQSIRQNAEFHKQSNQQVGSSIKSLRERRQELQEWVSRPIQRRYHKSEGNYLELYHSDTASYCSASEEPDGMSSYASSAQSSTNTSPVHVPRVNLHLDSTETSSTNSSSNNETAESKEPILFRSLKERFQELEKAVSKPVRRTCADPKKEIDAEKHSKAEENKSLSEETYLPSEETPLSSEETLFLSEETLVSLDETLVSFEETLVPSEETPVSSEETPVSSEETLIPTIEESQEVDGESSHPKSRSNSSPLMLEAVTSSDQLKRATSCESNYTDARSELSAQDSSEDSFHSGYATPTES